MAHAPRRAALDPTHCTLSPTALPSPNDRFGPVSISARPIASGRPACVRACARVRACACERECACARGRVSVCISVHICACVRVCVSLCVCGSTDSARKACVRGEPSKLAPTTASAHSAVSRTAPASASAHAWTQTRHSRVLGGTPGYSGVLDGCTALRARRLVWIDGKESRAQRGVAAGRQCGSGVCVCLCACVCARE
jgi:hypothetical protein